jgi:hypothetical protein
MRRRMLFDSEHTTLQGIQFPTGFVTTMPFRIADIVSTASTSD